MSLKEWQYKAGFKEMAVIGEFYYVFSDSVAARRPLKHETKLPKGRYKGKMKLTGKRRLWRYRRKANGIVLGEIPNLCCILIIPQYKKIMVKLTGK